MKIDYQKKSIHINVRGLAAFKPGICRIPSKRQLVKAQIGQLWHQKIQEQTSHLYEGAQFEVPLHAKVIHRDWTIHLEGRVDQVIVEGTIRRFIEVKSLYWPLPLNPAVLLEHYPDYFCQAITYACMAKTLPAYSDYTLQAELLLVNPETELTQTVTLGLGDEGLFYTQLEAIVQYAQKNDQHQERKKASTFHLPYPHLRPEQDQLLTSLNQTENPIIALEAPTGFGKTGVSLYWGLELLKHNHIQRIIYLTSKSTGQWSADKVLHTMLEADSPLRVHHFQSKDHHAIQSPLHTCDIHGLSCHEGLERFLKKYPIEIEDLFEGPFFSLQKSKQYGHQTGICPYILSRNALNGADIWVGDYNYIFSPSHSGVFENQISYDPAQTLLIIDEAHNLTQRVEKSLSKHYTAEDAIALMEALKLGDLPPTFLSTWEQWASFLKNLTTHKKLTDDALSTLLLLAPRIKHSIEQTLSQDLEIPPEIRLQLWETSDMDSYLKDARFEKLIYAPEDGTLSITCLDARRFIRPILERFQSVLLMSATLNPIPDFIQECGLKPKQASILSVNCPWQLGAYETAIDKRLNTQYHSRPQTYALTAETLKILKQQAAGQPIVGFFPSYVYAEAVYDLLKIDHPETFLQPKTSLLSQPEPIIQQALKLNSILLLVLGSHFSESIDTLGGKIPYALVAGPGLPAMTVVEEATCELLNAQHPKAIFRTVYQIPALRKVHQALGRLVRNPEHKTRILLHCERFQHPDYFGLLHPAYHPDRIIHSTNDLYQWLTNSM